MPAVCVLVFVLLVPALSFGSTPQEQYKKIQERMLEQKKKLTETQQKESSILNDIEGMNLNLGKIEGSLRKYRAALNRTEAEIAAVNKDIAETTSRLDTQKQWLARRLRSMNRHGYRTDTLMLLLSSDDLSGLMRNWKYLEVIARHEHEVLEQYREDLKKLDDQNRRLQALKADLKVNSDKVMSKEGELARHKRSKETLLASVRNEKTMRQKMLNELNDASRRLLDLMRESARTDNYGATGFSKLKGRLPWPVIGRLAVPYGPQRDAQFDTPVFRNGIQIKTGTDADARSIHSGKVIFADWFKGFGQLVIVNHGGGYHSLYGNLSEIFSHVGDIIKENQVIGKVGTSGLLNAPGLYFEIRYKGKPLDPIQWLKNKRG